MDGEPCHGVYECLHSGSNRWVVSPILKPWQKLRSYVVWHIENLAESKGLAGACMAALRRKHGGAQGNGQGQGPATPEILALEPGEMVEVKSVDEILTTLDRNRRHRGLLWMTGMRKYCGKQYRVHKRLERIMLESNGEMRNMKNTVLLEAVCCDGKEFGGCDRSCFHFWREAWLKRVESK
ncbi:MAG: hypothetical protein A2Y76_13735 [Planctomycetes bacterium RBG_13_60_9]|nr:MAG: hypothetical protein A2Y76_13735 [Planctomycetes bacterium RBG_13_60_9]